ncbi:hypothetical protein V7S43_003220 [Phytophthora oleae]|uniref:Cell growth-regulating nucleolar protein-like winged helix domain-containing protein n=1 Tax=Phytophthora oleae TaxID=2107226 RepID=A0ABD3FX13_9STRA
MLCETGHSLLYCNVRALPRSLSALRDTTLVEKACTIYERAIKASAPVEESASKKRSAEPESEEVTVKKSKTKDRPIKWSKLIKSALKSAGKELDMDALRDQVVKQIQNSGKSEKELKESEKFSVVEVVRLKCGNKD